MRIISDLIESATSIWRTPPQKSQGRLRNTPTLVEAVRQLVERILGQGVGPEDLATPLRGLGLDSVAMIELIPALEVEFQIRVLDEEITPEHFRSIDSVAGYVAGKL